MKKILIINANYYNNITLQLLNASKKILKRNKIEKLPIIDSNEKLIG